MEHRSTVVRRNGGDLQLVNRSEVIEFQPSRIDERGISHALCNSDRNRGMRDSSNHLLKQISAYTAQATQNLTQLERVGLINQAPKDRRANTGPNLMRLSSVCLIEVHELLPVLPRRHNRTHQRTWHTLETIWSSKGEYLVPLTTVRHAAQ